MTPVSAAHGGDPGRVPRCGEPVVDRGADLAPLHWGAAGPMMAGDQQDDALLALDRLLERTVDRPPGAVEAHPMEVDDAVRPDVAGAQPAVPASVEAARGTKQRGTAGRRSNGLRRAQPGRRRRSTHWSFRFGLFA